MSNYQTQHAPAVAQNAGDADLLIRLGIVLALRQRAGWQVVRIGVRNGVVRLAGVVPTFSDRQLIATVTSHVAGVLRVDDDLTVVDPPIRATAPDSNGIFNRSGSHSTTGDLRNPFVPFLHLPVVSESLDDILTRQAATKAPAS